MYELIGDSRAAAYLIPLITVGLGGMVGWWLQSLIGPAGQPNNAVELGRKWAGWVVLAVCFSMLSRFFGKLDAVTFFKMLGGGGTWVAVAYVLGWGYGKFFKFNSTAPSPLPGALPTPSATNTPAAAVSSPAAVSNSLSQSMQPVDTEVHTEVDENAIYAAIGSELESGATDKGLWFRLFAECDGDENKTKVAYIKSRAEKLKALDQEKARLDQAARERAVVEERIERLRLERLSVREKLMEGNISEELLIKLRSLSSTHAAVMLLISVRRNKLDEVRAMLAEEPLLVAVCNSEGDTPLHLAVKEKHETMARLLLDNGAPLDVKNRFDVTPLEYANNSRQPNMVRLLTSVA